MRATSMAMFITRIQLPEGSNYNRLHELMEVAGFTRPIYISDGKYYHLPWAEYLFDSTRDHTAAQVRDHAYAQAKQLSQKAQVLTAKAEEIASRNLAAV